MLFLNWLVFLTQTSRDHHPCSWTPGHKPLVPRGIWGISPCTAPCSAVVDRLSYSAGNNKSFQNRVGLNLVPVDSTWLTVFPQLPPPSYEQVIREKSREQNTQTSSVTSSSSSSTSSPSASVSSPSSFSAPRHTTTIATQTDPETSEQQSCTRPSSKS